MLTFLLLGVPFVLAFLTSYFTPQIGLSCRSLTFTVSFCIQVAQIGLWLWAHAWQPPADVHNPASPPNARVFYPPTELGWLFYPQGQRRTAWEVVRSSELWSLHALHCGTYYLLLAILGFGGIFSSLGGTLMQIMGRFFPQVNTDTDTD